MKENFKRRFCVAPMMGYTTPYARKLYRILSKKTFLFTEMIAAKSMIYSKNKDLIIENDDNNPVALQVGGSNYSDLKKCSEIAYSYNYDEINLNVGCPSDRVQKGKFGACLMLEPELVKDCLGGMKNSVHIPISIKCRLGVDDNESYEFLHNFISIVKESGINIFIIHARNGILKGLSPRQNRNIPPLKYDYVYKLKKDFPDLEIIINGGIKSIEECHNHLSKVDGVMLGRSAYENPFILKNVESEIFGLELQDISKKEILNQYLDYVERKLSEGHDLGRMMKHLFGLSRGDKYAKSFRIKILEVIKKNSLKDHKKDLEDLLVY